MPNNMSDDIKYCIRCNKKTKSIKHYSRYICKSSKVRFGGTKRTRNGHLRGRNNNERIWNY